MSIENDVFCDKFLLSRGRDEVFLRQNGGLIFSPFVRTFSP